MDYLKIAKLAIEAKEKEELLDHYLDYSETLSIFDENRTINHVNVTQTGNDLKQLQQELKELIITNER